VVSHKPLVAMDFPIFWKPTFFSECGARPNRGDQGIRKQLTTHNNQYGAPLGCAKEN
jgi:hypothetical protein